MPEDEKKTSGDAVLMPGDAVLMPENQKTINKSKYVCKYCNTSFSQNGSMNRHMKSRCKKKDEYMRLKEENALLRQELKETKETLVQHKDNMYGHYHSSNNNTVNSNNTTINNTINIYGKEDTSHLGPLLTHLLTYVPTEAITALIGKKYFDSNHPENQTVKITNKKDKWIYVHESGGWELRLKKKVIHNMIDDSFQDLNDHFVDEKLEDTLPKHKADQWGRVKETFHDKSLYKNHEHETERIILNKQDVNGMK